MPSIFAFIHSVGLHSWYWVNIFIFITDGYRMQFESLLEVDSCFPTPFRLPSSVKKVFHPIICCALSSVLTAFAFGYFSKLGLDPVLGYYLTNVSNNPGAGDILMGFLGSVILSFSFSMFKQRKVIYLSFLVIESYTVAKN